MRLMPLLGVLAVCTLGVSSVQAAPILAPISATVSSIDPFGGLAVNAINQSGLSATYTAGVTDFDTFVATTTAGYNSIATDLAGAGAPPASFTFDFGSPVSLDAIAIWNQFGSASLDTFTLQTSLVGDFSVSQTFGVFTMSVFGGANPSFADVFMIPDTTARFVRINALTNASFATATRINEVVFRQSTVPEPASMLLLGVGLAGGVLRRARARRNR